MTTTNPYAPPKADVQDVSELEAAPALWNPRAAFAWSIVFTPVLGALVHMKNWQALGEPEKAEGSKRWAIGLAVAIVVFGALSGFFPENHLVDIVTTPMSIVVLVAWHALSGRSQQFYVRDKFGNDYRRRSWGQPIGYALLATLGVIVAIVALTFVIA